MKATLFINNEQLQRVFMLCWRATRISIDLGLSLRVPVAVIGDTGTGKTEGVKAFHKYLLDKLSKSGKDIKLYTTILSMVPPEDIGGIPMLDKVSGTILHRMLGCLPFDSDEFSIILLDEFDRATPETQNPALQFLLGGEYHGHRLSPNAYPIIAMNGSSDIYTTPLSQAARSRLCSVFLSTSSADCTKSYLKWAKASGIPPVCQLFSEHCAESIVSTKEFEELAVCTRRSLDMCGMVTLAKEKVDKEGLYETDDIYPAVIAGLIGIEAMAKYLACEKALKEGVDPEKVILDPEDAPIPDSPSMTTYLLHSVLSLLEDKYRGNKKHVRAVGAYARRFAHDEWVEIWMSSLAKKYDWFVTDPLYERWVAVKKHRQLGHM